MPEHSAQIRHAITRARWSVLQTGLITTGLALFGVYVLANRINNIEVMEFYAGWFPLGPWLVGTIAGSGYAIASYFAGIAVRGSLLATVLALQLTSFIASHYAEFQTFDPPVGYRGEPVPFLSYFHRATVNLSLPLGADGHGPNYPSGYALRAIEAGIFSLGGLCSTFVLRGKPRCDTCGGRVLDRPIGAVAANQLPQTIKALETFAKGGDVNRLNQALQRQQAEGRAPEAEANVSPAPLSAAPVSASPPAAATSGLAEKDDAIELVLSRCSVCGKGYVERAALETGVPHPATRPVANPASAPLVHMRRIEIPPEFAETLLRQRISESTAA